MSDNLDLKSVYDLIDIYNKVWDRFDKSIINYIIYYKCSVTIDVKQKNIEKKWFK